MILELMAGLSLLAASTAAPPAPAVPCFGSEDQFEQWVNSYYRAPAPEKLGCGLEYYADSELYDQLSTRMPVAHFHAALLDDAALDALFASLSEHGSERARVMGLHVFWLAGTARGRALVQRAKQDWQSLEVQRVAGAMAEQAPIDVLATPVANPAAIDVLWAQFYATGSELAVRQVADALRLLEEPNDALALTGDAARRSLVRNVRAHPRVREILAGIRSEAGAGTAGLLDRILDPGDD